MYISAPRTDEPPSGVTMAAFMQLGSNINVFAPNPGMYFDFFYCFVNHVQLLIISKTKIEFTKQSAVLQELMSHHLELPWLLLYNWVQIPINVFAPNPGIYFDFFYIN